MPVNASKQDTEAAATSRGKSIRPVRVRDRYTLLQKARCPHVQLLVVEESSPCVLWVLGPGARRDCRPMA